MKSFLSAVMLALVSSHGAVFAAESDDATVTSDVAELTASTSDGPAHFSEADDEIPPLDLHALVLLSAATASVDIAQLERDVARSELGAQRMALRPTLDVTGTLQRSKDIPRFIDDNPDTLSTYETRIRLGQAIFDLEAWHNIDAANQLLHVEEASLHTAITESLRLSVLALLDVMTAEAELTVLEADLAQAQELARQAEARVELGASNPVEATRSAVEVQTTESAIVLARGRLHNFRIVLAELLNLPPGTQLRAAMELTKTLVPTDDLAQRPQEAEEYALAHRSEMRTSEASLSALTLQAKAVRSRRIPRLEAFAEAGYGGVFDETDDAGWSAGLTLTLPLINEDGYRSTQANLRAKQQMARQNNLEFQIRAQVRRTIVGMNTAEAQLASEALRSELAENELAQATERFSEGLGDNLAVVQAQRSFSSAKTAYWQALGNLLKARVNFLSALGSIQALDNIK